jgi:hypothetical protein
MLLHSEGCFCLHLLAGREVYRWVVGDPGGLRIWECVAECLRTFLTATAQQW